MFENLKSILDESEKRGIPALDCCLYQGGKEVFRDIRGVSDEDGTKLNGTERYNIYSCSKVITCAAALTLVQAGKISFDDEVAAYLPAFKDMKVRRSGGVYKAENKITVRHLFTMTAGLNYATASPEILRGKAETEGKCPTVDMMAYIAQMPLDFEPGESWNYSLCHDVLAAVVEVASKRRFGLYVKETIFDPLGMTGATFLLPENEVGALCAQYNHIDGKFLNVGKQIQYYKFGSLYESGGAGCVLGVNDYIRFLEGMRTGKILTDDTLEKMTRDTLTDRQRPACWVAPGYGYGLGVRVPNASGKRTDFGWGGAAGAYAAVDRKNGISLYYGQHVLASPNKDLRKDLIEAAKLDLGLEAFQEDMWSGYGNSLA